MKKLKRISFIFTITILILNLILPIIVNANTLEELNIENYIENVTENDMENDIEIENNIIENDEVINESEKDEIINDEKEDGTINEVVVNEQVEENTIDSKNEVKVTAEEPELGVKYSSHVQDIGWQNAVENGQVSGTTGRNLKVEAMKISLVNNASNINIKYIAYVQGIGWQKTVSNGQEAGTTGKNLRMDAIKIWLEGTDEYSVMYRTHVQDYGWLDWTYDGIISGKMGEDKKIEAIEIKIVSKLEKQMTISYSSHVQDIGWQSEKDETDISGTTGQNKKMEALKINLKNAPEGVSVKYNTYVEKSGWQKWTSNGQVSGTTGKNLKVFGIRIKLEGTYNYSIQYRAHIEDYGWTSWKKDGEIVGNIAYSKKIEAIQIRIVKQNVSNDLGVEYYTYLHGNSNNENKIETNGEVSGTTGENRKLDGIHIELINAPEDAHIKYKTHVQDIGWMDWVKDGELSGVINKNLKIEAIRIELEGMSDYTVEYKVHVQDIGWTDWYIDGEMAGTTGQNKKIEAVQIRIVPKYERYYKGIDVSYWQGKIDFDKLAASGQVDYMIARIGWYSDSQQKLVVDMQFERNYKEAERKNIPLGAYVYSYAMSVEGAKKEAESVVNYLKSTGQTNYELPIFYDIEDNTQIALGKDTITQMCITFCEVLKSAGFDVGVYSYSYWLENYMYLSLLPTDYSVWVAQYDKDHDGSLPDNIYKYANKYDMWQYSDKGKVDGIIGDVDMNICYKKYF